MRTWFQLWSTLFTRGHNDWTVAQLEPRGSIRQAPELTSATTYHRSQFLDALHVFVLCSFAVAQPMFDRINERPAFLIDRGIHLPAIGFIVVIFSLALPAFLVLIETLAGKRGTKTYNRCHFGLITLLFTLAILPVVNRTTFLTSELKLISAFCSGLLAAAGYFRYASFRSFITFASPGIVLFPIMLVWNSPLMKSNSGVTAVQNSNFQRIPVILLVCDEFCGSSLMTPDRQIDESRFPNFAALARDSTWFRNAASVNSGTEQALPAILSGRYATTIMAPSAHDLPQNVFSVLKSVGNYDLAAFEPVSRLASSNQVGSLAKSPGFWCQTSEMLNVLWRIYLFQLVPIDYQRQLPEVPVAWFGLTQDHPVDRSQRRGVIRYPWGENRDGQFQHFLETIDGESDAALHFMHILLPHMPWCYLPSGRRYAEDGQDWHFLDSEVGAPVDPSLQQDELDTIQRQQRYLLQVMYVDHLIGKLISRLKEKQIYDRCLLIVTADHGISFRPGRHRRNPEATNQDEIYSIPLLVKRPGQIRGEVSDRIVESVDIFPTIADIVGITLQGPVDGWSVFNHDRPARTHSTIAKYHSKMELDATVIPNSETPREIRKRFGNPSDPHALFRIGETPEIVDRSVEDFRISEQSDVKLEVRRRSALVSSDINEEFPCYFEGRVLSLGTDSKPIRIAVAVNGKIRGVTRTYRSIAFRDRWTILLPEDSFHEGNNHVRFYSVSGVSPNWVLSPCQVEDENATRR